MDLEHHRMQHICCIHIMVSQGRSALPNAPWNHQFPQKYIQSSWESNMNRSNINAQQLLRFPKPRHAEQHHFCTRWITASIESYTRPACNSQSSIDPLKGQRQSSSRLHRVELILARQCRTMGTTQWAPSPARTQYLRALHSNHDTVTGLVVQHSYREKLGEVWGQCGMTDSQHFHRRRVPFLRCFANICAKKRPIFAPSLSRSSHMHIDLLDYQFLCMQDLYIAQYSHLGGSEHHFCNFKGPYLTRYESNFHQIECYALTAVY